jgi:zinc transport system substrate-binding protein
MTFNPSRITGLLPAWCLAMFMGMSPAHAEPVVLASIKPLALIAEAVAGEEVRIDTLLPAGASPHDYPLRISDVRRLQAADVVLWVGPELESFLQRPLRAVPVSRQLEAQRLPGIHWPSQTDDNAHGHDQHHDHHQHDHLHERDPHIWLDPENAVVIARALAARLVEIKPEATAVFQANTERFASDMARLDKQLAVDMKRLEGKGFAVYHEGYAHFVERYGLHQLAHVTFTPERRPGARHMHHLRQQLRDNAECLFAEPYYDMRLANELARELDLRMGLLDPLGSQDVASYQQLLVNLAEAFSACLELE